MPTLLERRGLYAIIDPEHCAGRDAMAVARQVLAGGCAVLQLRDKRGDAGATRALAVGLQDLCRQAGVPFVLNDDPALAAQLGADGLHLGQGDMPVADARALVGAMPIGLSTHDARQAAAAVAAGADLIGFGPVFATTTKDNPDPVVGLRELASVCRASPIPVVAIGGITQSNADQVLATGARFIAAIGAVCRAEDPAAAAAALHQP